MGIATMTVLSDILLENNRQRMNLFGLANKAKDVNVFIIDFMRLLEKVALISKILTRWINHPKIFLQL